MKNNKGTEKEKKFFVDENGNKWDEEGNFVEEDCAPGSLMDRINRRCRGEDVPVPEQK